MGFCNMPINKLQKTEYPFLLRQISRLPETMDIIGSLPSDENKFLCVIGSRKFSTYGMEACRKIVLGLRGYPIVIVSGLAIGVDSISHEAAIDASLKTISFPGSGLAPSVLYPPSKRPLAKRIVESGGALISSFPYEMESTPWTFPVRNRLMAGISHATLIIEAAKGSGTLITADYAAEFARDILTVPGSIFVEQSYGPHMLIRRGATPVTCAEDVLQALGFKVDRKDGMDEALPNFAEMSLSEDQMKIIDNLKREPLSSSKLIEKTSFTSSKLNTIMSELELREIVKENEGQYFLK
jgi:DNA processing protein